MALMTFGNWVEGGSFVQCPPGDNKAVCRFQNNTGYSITASRVWVRWGIPASGVKIKAVVYSDNAGAPDALLATSNEKTAIGSGWEGFDLPSPISVPSGAYVWVGVISDTTILSSVCLNTGTIYYNFDPYSDGASAAFGAAVTAGYTYQVALEGDDGQLRFGRATVVETVSGNYQTDRGHCDRVLFGGAIAVSVSSIHAYVQTTSATVKCKAAIFNDNAGTPGTKIAQTNELTGTTAGSWAQLNFASPVSLSPGTYWLAFISSENLVVPVHQMGGNIYTEEGAETEASAFASPAAMNNNLAPSGMPIYATYSAAGPTPIAGEIPVSLTGSASLKVGTALSGDIGVALTGSASVQTGTHLAAIGRIETTPRGRLAGGASTAGAGNFFLLF